MPSIIKAGNATDGVQVSSDNTGTLDLRTGTGAGTTAISINASQVVTIPGSLIVAGQPAGGNYVLQNYVAPATWSKPAGLKAVKVTVVGAGGNGGSTSGPTVGSRTAGGGGGGGAAIEFIPAPSIPGPVAVTAGPGTNSFGAFCSATAGSAGSNTILGADSPGGVGGAGSGGNLNFLGTRGAVGPSGSLVPGYGGNSILSGIASGQLAPSPGTLVGTAGLNFGGGGAGASTTSAPGTPVAGGTGAPGIVIVEEFY